MKPIDSRTGLSGLLWPALLGLRLLGCGSDEAVGQNPGAGQNQPPVESTQWSSFGHDLLNTRHNPLETAITPKTAANLAVSWTRPGDEVTSTPAVVDGVVYYADWSGKLYAVNATDGSVVWETQLSQAPVQCSPVVTEDRIYIGDMRAVLYAVDRATGATVWSKLMDEHESANFTGSPVVADDHILVGIASYELGDRKPDYTFRGNIVSVNPESGEVDWRVYVSENDNTSGAGVSVWSSPAVDVVRKVMYIGTGQTYEEPASPRADAVVAIHYDSGEVAWVTQFTEGDVYTLLKSPPQGPDADIGAAPNLFAIDGRDVVGVGDKAGVYAALDRETGEELWATQLGPGSHLGGVMVAAAYADGAIYTASNRWPGGFDTENIFLPNFDDPENTSVIYRLDARTGDKTWEVPMPHPTLGAMALAGGVLYTGTTDGVMRALDTETGATLFEHKAGATMGSGQSISNGKVFTGYGFDFIGITGGDGDQKGGLTAYGLP